MTSRILSICIFLLLAACKATLPVAENPQHTWLQQQQRLESLTRWDVRGRVALTMDQDAWQLTLRWQNQPPRQQIDLSGPFGAGAVRIAIDDHGARLTDSTQHTYYAADAQQLLWQATGWKLPLENMAFWLRGLPVPGKDKTVKLNDQGLMKTLHQDGWILEVVDYAQQGDLVLPRSIELKKSVAESDVRLHVRLVISQWQRQS